MTVAMSTFGRIGLGVGLSVAIFVLICLFDAFERWVDGR